MKIVRTLFVCLLCGITVVHAQIHAPIKWHFSAVSLSNSEAVLYFTANIDEGWHVYSQFIAPGGPLPTTFNFSHSEDYSLIEEVKEESTPIKTFDNVFMMSILWFERTAVFSQKIKLNAAQITVNGNVEFMGCKYDLCLPPQMEEFNVEVKVRKPQGTFLKKSVKKKDNQQMTK